MFGAVGAEKEAESDYSYMFHIFRNEDGCGYAIEVVGALTQIGFEELGFHRLETHINPDTPASKAVVAKCGYTFERIRKSSILENGVRTDNGVCYRNAPSVK